MNQFEAITLRANTAAFGLIADLWHELPSGMIDHPDDLDNTRDELVRWIKCFSLNFSYGLQIKGDRLVRLARREAAIYYGQHLQQRHHTHEDSVFFQRTLSRYLLRACAWSSVEIGFFMGHFNPLSAAVHRMIWQAGIQERRVGPFIPWQPLCFTYRITSTPN